MASHVLTLVEDMAGEAGSQPGVCRGNEIGPMMADTHSRVSASKTCPSCIGLLRVS